MDFYVTLSLVTIENKRKGADMLDVTKEIKLLVQMATASGESEDALRFSQAACNSANAMACVRNIGDLADDVVCGTELTGDESSVVESLIHMMRVRSRGREGEKA